MADTDADYQEIIAGAMDGGATPGQAVQLAIERRSFDLVRRLLANDHFEPGTTEDAIDLGCVFPSAAFDLINDEDVGGLANASFQNTCDQALVRVMDALGRNRTVKELYISLFLCLKYDRYAIGTAVSEAIGRALESNTSINSVNLFLGTNKSVNSSDPFVLALCFAAGNTRRYAPIFSAIERSSAVKKLSIGMRELEEAPASLQVELASASQEAQDFLDDCSLLAQMIRNKCRVDRADCIEELFLHPGSTETFWHTKIDQNQVNVIASVLPECQSLKRITIEMIPLKPMLALCKAAPEKTQFYIIIHLPPNPKQEDWQDLADSIAARPRGLIGLSIRNEPGDESGIDHSEGYIGVVSALRRNETIEELSVNVCGEANETAVETMFESLESMLKDSNHTLLSLCVCERNLPPNIERLLSINRRGRPYAQIGKGLVLKGDLASLSRSVFPEVVTRICQVGGGLSAVYSATKHMSESLLHSLDGGDRCQHGANLRS